MREKQLCRTFEQLVRQVLNRVSPRRLLLHAGEIAVPPPLFLVPYVAFAFQDTKYRQDRGVREVITQALADLRNQAWALVSEHLHDVGFAIGQ